MNELAGIPLRDRHVIKCLCGYRDVDPRCEMLHHDERLKAFIRRQEVDHYDKRILPNGVVIMRVLEYSVLSLMVVVVGAILYGGVIYWADLIYSWIGK